MRVVYVCVCVCVRVVYVCVCVCVRVVYVCVCYVPIYQEPRLSDYAFLSTA